MFLLYNLRDRVDEKNERAKVKPSARSEAVVIVHRCNLLFPVKGPHPYKHGAPVRRFRKEPTPATWIIVRGRVFVSGNLPYPQIACNRRSLDLVQAYVPVPIEDNDKLSTGN